MDYMLLLQVIILFILPVLLIYFKIIPLKYIFPTIWTVFVLVVMISFSKNISLFDLGIRFDNIFPSIFPYLLVAIFGSLLIYFLAKKLNRKPFKKWWKFYHFQFGFIFLALFQEFLYRSFLIYQLKLIFPSFLVVVLVNAFLFSIMHLIFIDRKIAVPLTFLAGFVFSSIYYFYPNLLLITITHAILNFISSYYGFFKIPMKDRLRKKN